jgi:DNA polymerase III, gamma/tau subunits
MQFSQIIEQHTLINSLISMADRKRVPSAQLFLSSKASKGFAVALAFAQYLNCSNKKRFSPQESLLIADSCGQCLSCQKYQKLIHPDLHLVFPNTTTKSVDSKNSSLLLIKEFREFVLKHNGDIRLEDWFDCLDAGNKQGLINVRDANNIINDLSVCAYEAPYKVEIIWCADKLHYEAAPKLLKILEEPYHDTLFFLITDNKEEILPTILSRLQIVKVPFIRNKVADSKYLSLFVDWTRLCFSYRTKIAEIVSMVEKNIASLPREEQKQFLSFCLSVIQNALITKQGLVAENNLLENAEEKFRDNFPHFVTFANVESIYNELNEAILHIERNGNAKMVFLDLSIKLGVLLMSK